MNMRADVLICGAGIAGVSTAYHLAVGYDVQNILLVDERAPLSLTSNQSTECYRNWWPGPGDAMVALMNRSIDIMENLADESGNTFHLNRRGYLYCTNQPGSIPKMLSEAEVISKLGAGPLRVYRGVPGEAAYHPAPSEGYPELPVGADLLLDPKLIQQHFPYLSKDIVAVLHVRRAGWFSAQQMGMYMLDQARQSGVQFIKDRVIGIEKADDQSFIVELKDAGAVTTKKFVNAAGPLIADIGQMLDQELPVLNELHLKAAFKDHLGILHRAAPLLIFNEPQVLDWRSEERQFLEEDPDLSWLLQELPAGSHMRPEGGPDSETVLILWEYDRHIAQPVWPIPIDPQYAEIALRGLLKLIPELGTYIERLPRPQVDGGYYTKTLENRPLIGKLPLDGAYIIGALSGFGVMAACAAGELLAAHITDKILPPYAPAFALDRYADPAYQRLLADWSHSGQL